MIGNEGKVQPKFYKAPGEAAWLSMLYIFVACPLAFANSYRTLHWGWAAAHAALAVPFYLFLYLVTTRDPGVRICNLYMYMYAYVYAFMNDTTPPSQIACYLNKSM